MFQKEQVIKHQFLVKLGAATKHYFYIQCFSICEKVVVFWPDFGKFWLMFKKHCKHRCFSTCLKARKDKTHTILRGFYLGQVGVIIWAKFVAT